MALNFFPIRHKFFLIWWLQMAFIAICYMYIDLLVLQHRADRPGEYRTYDAHQSLHCHLLVFLHGDIANYYLPDDLSSSLLIIQIYNIDKPSLYTCLIIG